ncbi:MAG TPA: HIT domain-containing protein [Paracoccus sp.]|nr:HIT domain-containing protein [Paracoccus sp. (in: a-proteobacteria)]
MSQTCLFCRIAAGELPAHKVYEDEHVLAFLDLHPIRPGHTLIIPRAHHVWFEDLPPQLATRVMTCAQNLARVMKQSYKLERVGLLYTGIHVPHVHAHVVPMHQPHDVSSQAYMAEGPGSYTLPPKLPEDEMARIASDLGARLAAARKG